MRVRGNGFLYYFEHFTYTLNNLIAIDEFLAFVTLQDDTGGPQSHIIWYRLWATSSIPLVFKGLVIAYEVNRSMTQSMYE